jgi:hypothetical protein
VTSAFKAGALFLAWSIIACSGTPRPAEVIVWSLPQRDVRAAQVNPEHPVQPILLALESDDCATAVLLSAELMSELEATIAETFHPTEGEFEATALREALDEHVNGALPLVSITEHGFAFPGWWVSSYAYCLAESGDLETAREQYLIRLATGFDPDALFRLALVSSWLDRPSESLMALQSWPERAPTPPGFEEILHRAALGELLPRSIQVEPDSVD